MDVLSWFFLIGKEDFATHFYDKNFFLGLFLLGTICFGFWSYQAFEKIQDYNEISKGKIEEYYNIEKVGKTLVFELKKDNNVLKSHFSSAIEEKELWTYIAVDGSVRLEMLNISVDEDFFSPIEREELTEEQLELLTKRYVNADLFKSIECCLASVVKFEEEIFLSILENIKKKYKEVFGAELELDVDGLLENACELSRPTHGLNLEDYIDNTSPYSCIDIVLSEPSEEEQEKYGVGEIVPCNSKYCDELLYASILLTKILIETGQFSINKELFDESNEVDNGFALDFSYVNFERDLKLFSANSKLKIETKEQIEW